MTGKPRNGLFSPHVVAAVGLTTSAAVPLPARSAVLLNGGSLGELLGHLVLQAGHSDEESLLVDGLLQSLDVGLHLLLHALSEAAQVAASWSEPQGTLQPATPQRTQTAPSGRNGDVGKVASDLWCLQV